MKYVYSILLLSLLAACSSAKKPEPEVITSVIEKQVVVEVPVLYCPEPPNIARPKLAIQSLNKSSSQAEVLSSYGKSLEQTIDYANTLEKALASYKGLDKRKSITKDK